MSTLILLLLQSLSVQIKVSGYQNRYLPFMIRTTAKILALIPVRDFHVWLVQIQTILHVLKPMTFVFILTLNVMVILSVLTIVFLAISIGLYVKFTRYEEEIYLFLVILNINHNVQHVNIVLYHNRIP